MFFNIHQMHPTEYCCKWQIYMLYTQDKNIFKTFIKKGGDKCMLTKAFTLRSGMCHIGWNVSGARNRRKGGFRERRGGI
jgi:hypothetical protein